MNIQKAIDEVSQCGGLIRRSVWEEGTAIVLDDILADDWEVEDEDVVEDEDEDEDEVEDDQE